MMTVLKLDMFSSSTLSFITIGKVLIDEILIEKIQIAYLYIDSYISLGLIVQ